MTMELNDDQIAFLQQLINDAAQGEYEATSLVRGHEEYFYIDPRVFGKQLYRAVESGRLTRIAFVRMDRGSKHLIYRVG
jgi:hypothetical protein